MQNSQTEPDAEPRLMRDVWRGMYNQLELVARNVEQQLPKDLTLYKYWAFKVARYSFHTGHLVEAREPQRHPNTAGGEAVGA